AFTRLTLEELEDRTTPSSITVANVSALMAAINWETFATVMLEGVVLSSSSSNVNRVKAGFRRTGRCSEPDCHSLDRIGNHMVGLLSSLTLRKRGWGSGSVRNAMK